VEPRTKVPLGSISLYLSLGIAFVCCWTNESPTVAFAAVTGCVAWCATPCVLCLT
jgi:hypothetical protein